jgi:hypothetical protein
MESCYFNPDNFFIEEVNTQIAREFIIAHHYSKKWTLCNISYGLYYKTPAKNDFFNNDTSETLIGVIVYGGPVGRCTSDSISDVVNAKNVIELTRLAILDGYGKNIESWFISKTLKMLKTTFKELKVVISYSDQEMGHKGIIYQATGFYYQGEGLSLMPNYALSLDGPPAYNWIHSRTVSSMYGSKNIEHLKRCIGKTFWLKKEANKHRYFILVCDKIEKKRVLSTLKYPILPYPKLTKYVEEIVEIKVNDATFFA